jgi:hypothetical protein
MDIKRSRRLLKDISNYGWEKFQEAKALISETNSKHIMLVAYMSQCQVNFDGIISLTLPSRPQGTAGVLQLRALQECFINTKLITLNDDEVFANYLYINSEYERIRTTKVLLNQLAIDQAKHDEILNEANQIISNMKAQTTLPIIPGLIVAGKDYYDKQQFSLKKKCEIIDYLDTENSSVHKMVDNYDVVYKQLSRYVHPDARTILKNINFISNTSTININGDASLYEDIVSMSFMYYATVLEIFVNNLDIYEPRRFKLFSNRFDKYIQRTSS